MHEEIPNQKPKKSPYVVTYLVIFLFMMLLNTFLIPAYLNSRIETVDYGTFLNMLEGKQLATVQLEEQQIYFADAEGKMYVTNSVPQDYLLVNRLREGGVKFGRIYRTRGPLEVLFTDWILPLLPLMIIGTLISRRISAQMSGMMPGNSMMFGGKSGAKQYVACLFDEPMGVFVLQWIA